METVRSWWKTHQTTPNNDYDHFQLVCRLRKEVLCPYVVVAETDGRPLAILIARMEQTHFVPAVGYFKPIKISAKVLTVIHEALIGEVDEKIGNELIRHLWTVLCSRDIVALAFCHVPDDSPLLKALMTNIPHWWRERKPNWSVHWEMDIPDEQGFILKNMKSKHRSGLRSKEKKLIAAFQGKVAWRWITRFDDIPYLCSCIEEVASRTYQRGLGVGFVNDEEQRRRFDLFSKRGLLRMHLLVTLGKIRAYRIGIIYRSVFHGFGIGYDPELRKYRPGTLSFLHTMDNLVREGVKKVDFGLGDAHYKQRFGDRSWREGTVHLFAPSVKGLTLKQALGSFDALDRAARHLLQKTGGLNFIKTGWRRRVTPNKG